MERKVYQLIIFVGFTMFFHLSLLAQTDSRIYNAYITGDMQSWKSRLDELEKQENQSKADRLSLVDYHHGYIAWCIDKGKKKEAEIYIEKAEAHLAYLENEDYKLSDIFAYKAAFIGFEIGLARHKAPFIGPKSIEFAEKSIQLNKKNAMGYVQLGNIEYYTPKFAGGSKEIAVQHYQHALRIMESQKHRIANNWNYLNLLATLINAYVELGDLDKAADYCNKTREIEPNFDWVNNTLCPNIQKK